MMNMGRYDPVHCKTYPVNLEMNSAPMEPNIPPSPTTDPTARRGKVSDAMVNIFADQPWCPAAASPIKTTANHRLETLAASTIGTTARAQISMAVLRLRFTVHPRLIIDDENHPPAMLPTVAIWEMTTSGSPTVKRVIPWFLYKKSGTPNK